MRATRRFRLLPVALSLTLAAAPGFARAGSPDAVPDLGARPRVDDPAKPDALRAIGFASLLFDGAGGLELAQNGVALEFRVRNHVTPRFGADVTVTWGLTDWDRGKEWIDAGNSAGRWTTGRIQAVTHWVEEGGDSQPIRLVGAIFADMFLAMTYVAVPFCYVGSVAGTTSHLQLDVTGTARATAGPLAVYAEGGLGIAGLPERFMRWEYAAGPVVGAGFDVGRLRVGARLLWAPGVLTSTERADPDVLIGSAAVGARF